MRSRKLYHLLALFTEQDQKRFSLFLRSPYYNTSPTLLLFWEEWQQKVLQSEGGDSLTSAELVADSELKISQVDKLSSKLYLKAREFLKVEELETHGLVGDVLLTGALLKRDPEGKGNHRFVQELEAEMDALPASSEKYLALFFHQFLRARTRIGSRNSAEGLAGEFQLMVDHLDHFADSKVLQLACSALNIGRIFQQKATGLEAYLEGRMARQDQGDQGNHLVQVYRKVLELFRAAPTAEAVEELLETLAWERDRLAPDVLLEIYSFALNHCVQMVNKGNHLFLGPALDMHIQLLEMGVLLEDGKLPPQQFKNIVALGCRAGRLDWVDRFIKAYGNRLMNDHGGMAQRFNLGILRFHQGRFKEAIDILKEVIRTPGPDVFYDTDSRMYLWKAYYEASEELEPAEVDEMFRLYDSFRLYINRHSKISEQHRLQYRNHIRLFKRFLHVVQSKGEQMKGDLQALEKELAETSDFPNRTWLARKVEAALKK